MHAAQFIQRYLRLGFRSKKLEPDSQGVAQISGAKPRRTSGTAKTAGGPVAVIKQGDSGEVHYFEHASGRVAGVKFISNTVTV